MIVGNDPTIEPSFPLSHRLRRGLWNLVWTLLFLPSPRPLHGWRALLLRAFGARIGRHVHVYPSVRVFAPWNLTVGDHSGIGDRALVYNMDTIRIGRYCTVSQGAHLCGGTHDVDSANFQLVTRPIVLGDHVWVCAEAFVGPGVELAEGCVLGARAVLFDRRTEPWTVYAGHPARARRARGRAARGRTGPDAMDVPPPPGVSTRDSPSRSR